MKSFLYILGGLLAICVGLFVIVENSKALTTPILIFAAAFILLGFLLAIPARIHDAFAAVQPFVPKKWRGDDDAPK